MRNQRSALEKLCECSTSAAAKGVRTKKFSLALCSRAASPLLFYCVDEKQIIITVGEAISLFMARQMQDDVIHYFVK